MSNLKCYAYTVKYITCLSLISFSHSQFSHVLLLRVPYQPLIPFSSADNSVALPLSPVPTTTPC